MTPSVKERFALQLPPYPGASQCVRIGKAPSVDVAALRKNYVGLVLAEDQAKSDPIEQVHGCQPLSFQPVSLL